VSAPNKSFDPVEVSTLSQENIDENVTDAIAAIAGANSLDELKEVRLAHTGDRSPLALANREIGALPPAAKAEAGKRIGQARGKVNQSLEARTLELEVLRDQLLLVEETVDVTMAAATVAQGARHPLTTIQEQISDVFLALGYELAKVQKLKPNGLTSMH